MKRHRTTRKAGNHEAAAIISMQKLLDRVERGMISVHNRIKKKQGWMS
jgi:hypothetical protein